MTKITTLDQVRLAGRRLIWPPHKPRAGSRIKGPFKGPFKGHSTAGDLRVLACDQYESQAWRALAARVPAEDQAKRAAPPAPRRKARA